MPTYYLWIYGPGIFGHLIGGAGLILLCLYFLPSIIALARKKSNTGSIIVLNFFLGWTFIGWIVSLIWALSADSRPLYVGPRSQQVIINNNMPAERQVTPVMMRPTGPARQQPPPASASSVSSQDKITQLQQLKELLDNGVLTQEEFILQKSKILDS